jgi:hypothetical protein
VLPDPLLAIAIVALAAGFMLLLLARSNDHFGFGASRHEDGRSCRKNHGRQGERIKFAHVNPPIHVLNFGTVFTTCTYRTSGSKLY